MSTLEKAMELLQTIPEDKLDTVYTFLQFVKFQDGLAEEPSKSNGEDIFTFDQKLNKHLD